MTLEPGVYSNLVEKLLIIAPANDTGLPLSTYYTTKNTIISTLLGIFNMHDKVAGYRVYGKPWVTGNLF